MPARYTVPQFIDAEAKIMGPLSVRQFVELLATLLLVFITWKSADLVLAGILIFFEGALGLIFAFTKINGQDFHYFLLSFAKTFRKPRLRVWRKGLTKEELRDYAEAPLPEAPQPEFVRKSIDRGRLGELSLLVSTGGAYNPQDYE